MSQFRTQEQVAEDNRKAAEAAEAVKSKPLVDAYQAGHAELLARLDAQDATIAAQAESLASLHGKFDALQIKPAS